MDLATVDNTTIHLFIYFSFSKEHEHSSISILWDSQQIHVTRDKTFLRL